MKVGQVNKINKISQTIFFSILLVFAVLMLVVFLFFINKDIPDNYVETNATIEKIIEQKEYYGGEYHYQYDVTINYKYNDITYNNVEYPNYDSSMKENDIVLIYVNPNNPEEFLTDSNNIIFPLLCCVFIVIAVIGIIRIRK